MLTSLSYLIASDKVRPAWVVKSFPTIQLVVVALIAVCSIFMIVAVLMQQGNTNGMTGITSDSSDTFYNKNKGKSMEGKIKKLTVIDSILIVALCILYVVLFTIYHEVA